MMLLLVFIGGAVGAPARYLTDRWVQSRRLPFPTRRQTTSRQRVPATFADLRFPFGTLLINAVGSLILGIILGGVARHGWSGHTQALVGTGFCGGLTTFSTFSVETVELLQGRLAIRAAGYVALSCAVGIGLAALGYRVIAG